MEFAFEGPVWFWRGPAPWYFVTVPPDQCAVIKARSGSLTYGWGMIPVHATIGRTTWYTAMWPKDDLYILPIKANIRKAEKIDEGDIVSVYLSTG